MEATVRYFSLAISVLYALPCTAQEAATQEDLLSAASQNPGIPAASQPLFQMPMQIRAASDIPFWTSEFTFVRVSYSQRDDASDVTYWTVDYPDADVAFTEQVRHLTGLSTDPGGRIIKLTDPSLGQYPFIYMVEGGYIQLTDEEAVALRSYLLGGGFLMVDDFWGDEEWTHLSAEFRKVFPERDIIEIPADHEVFRSYFQIDASLPVPGVRDVMINDVQGTPFQETIYRGLIGDDGRLMAIFCHNADFGDGWEHANSVAYPVAFSFGRAIPMGINIVVYALSH